MLTINISLYCLRLGCIFSILILIAGCNQRPANYDDCILKNISSGMSDTAVATVRRSCRQLFPVSYVPLAAPKPEGRALTPHEIDLLYARAGVSDGKRYGGTLYNGTSLKLNELEMSVTTTIEGRVVPKIYRTIVNVSPLATTDFGFNIIPGDSG